MKGLILAGGRGKRLNEYTELENKCMMPFDGKPLIEYSLENVCNLGLTEIVIVVGHMAEQIINTYGNAFRGTPIKYVIQRDQMGLVHAMECGQKFIGDSNFLLLLGDEFFIKPDHDKLIRVFHEEQAFAVCGIIQVEDRSLISKTYSILYDRDSRMIFRLIEKPKNPSNNFMGTGNIIFNHQIFDYLPQTPINQKRGEREMPDLIQCAIDDGKKVLFQELASQYINVNSPEEVTILNEIHRKKRAETH
jgi:UDP-N-acetylglucosamine diphosphorylase / glucose-1-phosphate thymidylyltransferase / UDP-N-acetylgalactosamine diphosphorylase / glucosamine-1-phosphate N-acetyltransferase / galactosamine-1-phosphate N-acetyltransferase